MSLIFLEHTLPATKTPILATTDSLIGRRVRYTEFGGDALLREDDDGTLDIGDEGTVLRLESHVGIGTGELTKEERDADSWIIVRWANGGDNAFWREELSLLD